MSVYMYIYMYVYIYICMYVYIYVCIYIYICIYMYMYMYMYMYVCMYVCTYVCDLDKFVRYSSKVILGYRPSSWEEFLPTLVHSPSIISNPVLPAHGHKDVALWQRITQDRKNG
jgi:hypothetical protein